MTKENITKIFCDKLLGTIITDPESMITECKLVQGRLNYQIEKLGEEYNIYLQHFILGAPRRFEIWTKKAIDFDAIETYVNLRILLPPAEQIKEVRINGSIKAPFIIYIIVSDKYNKIKIGIKQTS